MKRLLFLMGVLLALLAACEPVSAPPADEDVAGAIQPATFVSTDVWDVTPVPIGISTIGTFSDANQKRCVTEGNPTSGGGYNETVATAVDLTGVLCSPGNVISAVLRLTYDSWNGAISFNLHKILRPWNPSQVSWTQAATGQPWAAIGGTDPTDSEATPAAVMTLCSGGCGNGTSTVDVTTLVQGWLAAPATARGFLVRTNNYAAAGQPYHSKPAHFWPNNTTTESYRPRLRITCPGGLGAICGNGAADGTEGCDDGNTVSGDGCSSSCAVETGFVCGGAPSVCAAVCGDGEKASTEGCDDGGAAGGDGCSASCGVEFGYTCAGVPSLCGTTCGDGKVAGDEDCDDGGVAPGDGCSAGCAVELGFACAGMQPSACASVCGDGILVGGESCDDGALVAGDGCGACVLETGWACAGAPSSCATTCGDGVAAGAEECDDGNGMSGDGCSAGCIAESCTMVCE